uniref:Uncharacterized protein n=1 Tax=Fagus sylvatica TaxID=28930 RepID=A0A2N9I299_FAGSY
MQKRPRTRRCYAVIILRKMGSREEVPNDGEAAGNTSIALFGLGISIRALAARDFGARKGSRVDSGWAWVEAVFGVETMVQKK